MTTTFEQMKAAVEAATKGEWVTSEMFGPTNIESGRRAIAATGGYSDNQEDTGAQNRANAAAIVAALNWLRGGGIERYEQMREALRPFAAIAPSSLYPADGSEAEGYCVLLAPINGNPVEYTGADLARARAALAATEEAK